MWKSYYSKFLELIEPLRQSSDVQRYYKYCQKNKFFTLILFIFLIGIVVAACWGKEEILPTFFVSLVSLMVVYGSSQDSKNKLRLELFEKRYEIYEELIKFSSHTLQEGEIGVEAANAAYQSFRGLKYHKSKFLFGDDVNNYFNEINGCFATMSAARGIIPSAPGFQEWTDKKFESLKKIMQITDVCPTLFAPYLYFGDIKNKGNI